MLKSSAQSVVVTHAIIPAKDILFPEKLEKANEILSKTRFMDEGQKIKPVKK